MEPVKEIIIACEGATLVSLDELTDLQGNLKDLSEQNYVKLRNSITQFGFSFPILMWIDPENKKWIIDAHQRIRTLKKMQEEGIIIPRLPADIVHAKDKNEAKKKLLLLNSRYGKMTREGFDEFSVDLEDMSDLLELPEIQFNGDIEPQEEGMSNPEKIRDITCPECGHKIRLFDIKETN